jgi:hypothetical protein
MNPRPILPAPYITAVFMINLFTPFFSIFNLKFASDLMGR